MPALSPVFLVSTLITARDDTGNLSAVITEDASQNAIDVVCAWPVSGQYGPGSRILYYVLVAACVVARKAEWLRNACLAAALLFPAVAAIHGIVLAALHKDGAVDMDVYGAFQLCSIGVLAAPVTVRLSKTYFYDPGRNTIFVWTLLLLAGLLSLTVEFFRIETTPCFLEDSNGNPITDASKFPYNDSPTCGLTCTIADGPFSPMRQDAANEIFVVPAPHFLSFGTATFLAAACCIPAILSLVSMWNKILQINWKKHWGRGAAQGDEPDEEIEGTNGATLKQMKGVNEMVRFLMSVVEIPAFSAAVLAILVVGEQNFWSPQLQYQTEPIESIGQWSPIVGTVLATVGSLYVLFASGGPSAVKKNESDSELDAAKHCSCCHHHSHPSGSDSPRRNFPSIEVDRPKEDTEMTSFPLLPRTPTAALVRVPRAAAESEHLAEDVRASSIASDVVHPVARYTTFQSMKRSMTATDYGGRRKVHKSLTQAARWLGTAQKDLFDDSDFRRGKAQNYPEIPGERSRNPKLAETVLAYNPQRDRDGNVTPNPSERRARALSDNASMLSVVSGLEPPSPQTPTSPRSPSPYSFRGRAGTLPVERERFPGEGPPGSPSSAGPSSRAPVRRVTLEVPLTTHGSSRNSPPTLRSPAIVISTEPESSRQNSTSGSEPDSPPPP